jgi:hypothetical protein
MEGRPELITCTDWDDEKTDLTVARTTCKTVLNWLPGACSLACEAVCLIQAPIYLQRHVRTHDLRDMPYLARVKWVAEQS